MLLLVMMSAVGVFAAQATAFEVRTAGYVRQAMQTHYVSEAATMQAVEEFGQRPDAYRRFMNDRSKNYYPMGQAELAKRSPRWDVYPPSDPLGPGVPLTPQFEITLADVFVSRRPIAGAAVAGGTSTDGPVNVFVAISTRGSLSLAAGASPAGRAANSSESGVSHVTVLNVQQ